MGDLLLCRAVDAEQPYFNSEIGIPIYTMEELCWYMESNVYMLDESWINESLFQWIGKYLHDHELGEILEQEQRKKTDLYDIVYRIFAHSGIYYGESLRRIHDILESMKGKTRMERHKMRGDKYLEDKKYKRAAYIYMELLQPECIQRMTEELQGEIMHNLGVVYARMFLFQEAATMFVNAYKTSHMIASRDAYLYAMNYVPDTFPMDEDGMDINFSVMKDALARFSEVNDKESYYIERKEAAKATDAFNWRSSERSLLARWKDEFSYMNS